MVDRIAAGRDGEFALMTGPIRYALTDAYGSVLVIQQGIRGMTIELDDKDVDFTVEVTIGAETPAETEKLPGSTWFLGLQGDVLANDHNNAAQAVSIRLKAGTGLTATAMILFKVAAATISQT